jgi:hypothetical protein
VETSLAIPLPLEWQRRVLDEDKRRKPRLTTVAVGRRAGKSHLGLLWLLFAVGGLMEGFPCAWGSPTDVHQADIRNTFKNWMQPMIKGPSPGGLGFDLVNGGRLDFWTLAPGHTAFRGRHYSLCVLDECAFVRNLTETIEQNLLPALAQDEGRLMLASTPKGFNDFHDWFRKAEKE